MPSCSPEIVTDQQRLEALCERLRGEPRIGFDTESASFHRYVDRVYLMQVSTDTVTALIDPLAVADLRPVGAVLADPDIEVTFHDADYDLRVLDRDYGFRATRLFDTRIAAQLAGEAAIGLGALLERYFAIRLDKKHQRADWSKRPLSSGMLEYAAADTQHLLALRDLLEEQLRALDRLHWAQEEFMRLESLRWTQSREPDEAAFLRVKGARSVPRRHWGVLQAVHAWREAAAREADRPPFRILPNEALIALARAAPQTAVELASLRAVPSKIAARVGPALLAAVREGLSVPEDALPKIQRSRRPAPDPAYDIRLERLKTLRDAGARRVDLDPGLLCPNGTLQVLARATPVVPEDLNAIPELRRWQREVLGDRDLLAAVAGS